MSKEMTSQEYLNQYTIPDPEGGLLISIADIPEYKRLVAKEAVKEFAEELILDLKYSSDDSHIAIYHVTKLCKKKGIKL